MQKVRAEISVKVKSIIELGVSIFKGDQVSFQIAEESLNNYKDLVGGLLFDPNDPENGGNTDLEIIDVITILLRGHKVSSLTDILRVKMFMIW